MVERCMPTISARLRHCAHTCLCARRLHFDSLGQGDAGISPPPWRYARRWSVVGGRRACLCSVSEARFRAVSRMVAEMDAMQSISISNGPGQAGTLMKILAGGAFEKNRT